MVCILAATDLTEDAADAVRRAAMLVEELAGELHVLHVQEAPPPRLLASLRAAFERVEHEGVEHAAAVARAAGVEPHVIERPGSVHREILTHANTVAAELVVVGSTRLNSLTERVIGSVVSRLLQHGHHPVLVTKLEPERRYRRVLIMIDGSPASGAALEAALRLTGDGCEVNILHAYRAPFAGLLHGEAQQEIDLYLEQERENARTKVETFLDAQGRRPDDYRIHLVRTQSIAAAGLAFIHDREVDLVATGTRGNNRLLRSLFGSVSKNLLYHAPCDVLVAPPGAAASAPDRDSDPT
ncbi:MAG: universal stress protein [Acidobacteriota bacterium]